MIADTSWSSRSDRGRLIGRRSRHRRREQPFGPPRDGPLPCANGRPDGASKEEVTHVRRHPHVRWSDDPAPPPRHDLVDFQLLEEIELLVDVITRVAGHTGYLSRDEVDSALGLSHIT